MSRPTFLMADLHFCDIDMCQILDGNTTPLRPFISIEEHDETLIANWNNIVPKDAKVYLLGDIFIKKEGTEKVGRLNGSKKILIRGNHDILDTKKYYLPYFYDIRATHRLSNGILMSHIPVHPGTFGKAHKLNVQGHIHNRVVMKNLDGFSVPDERYFCVSAERLNYTPISLEEIIARNLDILNLDIVPNLD